MANSSNSPSYTELKTFLDEKFELYHTRSFIDSDPVQIAHQFHAKEDIEISAFLVSLFSWGKRIMIIQNAEKLMFFLDNEPAAFIKEASPQEFEKCLKFVHRTMNGTDMVSILMSLRKVIQKNGDLETAFMKHMTDTKSGIIGFREEITNHIETSRTLKHLSNPGNGSAAKRTNMFLRWMVRQKSSVDFGIWKGIKQNQLMLPLDVHTGRVARSLGLLNRKQNDWRAVEEVTENLKKLDIEDPIKYDYALFGLGVFEDF